MSSDKNKAERRRLDILWAAYRGMSPPSGRPGILFHREGGRAIDNPDIQRLIRDGYLEICRISSTGRQLSPKKFAGNFRNDYRHYDAHPHLHGQVNVTWGIITEKGLRLLGVKLGDDFEIGQQVIYTRTDYLPWLGEEESVPAFVVETNPVNPILLIETLDGKRLRVLAEDLK